MKNTFKTFRLPIIVVLIFSTASLAQSGIDYFFEQGNESYRENDYQTAIDWYQKILDAGYEGGRLYYNLGNCYYKLDKIGYAILYYEKSQEFLPDDPEVNFNLELARLKVVDSIEMPPRFFLFEWWEDIKDFYSIHQLINLVTVLYILTSAILIIFLFLKADHVRRFLFPGFIVLSILTLFWGYILFTNIHEEKANQHGIVLSPNVTILSAPNENSTDVFVLHEGVKVKLDDRREDWVKISLPDGKSGWMKRAHVGII